MEVMTKNYTDVLLEDINGKFDIVVEMFGVLKEQLDQKADKSDVEEMRQDIRALILAVTEDHRVLQDHERRITKLEAV